MGHNRLPVDESTERTDGEQHGEITISEGQYQRLREDIKNDVVAEIKSDLETEFSSRESSNDEIDIRSEEESAGLEDIWIAGNPVGMLLSKALQNSKSGGDNSDDNPKGSTGEDDITPFERLIELREQDENHPALPKNGRESFDRAVSIFENFGKWSEKTPKGRVLKGGLKTLIETATGEDLRWKQVYRAMDALEQWTQGEITHQKHRRHGHILVSDEQPSSAATS